MENVKLEKYSDYKYSGVEWLGDIPKHWETLSNKFIFSLKKNLVGKRSSEYVLLSLTLNGVIKRDMENPQGKFPAEFDTYQEVKKGDFIFCLFDVEETPRTVGLSEFDGMITGAYTVMQPNENFDRGFLYYFYLNLDTDKRMKPLYTGLRNTISKDNFFSFKTFVPPHSEQTAIAEFLDRKTALIDQAVGIKEKQIELLKERRQILIHRAVTRGENPEVKLKDSGVEWIGEIPEHWGNSKLGYYTNSIQTGPFGSQLHSYDYIDNGIPVINPSHIIAGEIRPDYSQTISLLKQDELKQHTLETGDIVFGRRGEMGRCAIVHSDNEVMISGTGSIKLSFDKKRIYPYYINHYLKIDSLKDWFSLNSVGSTMENLNSGILSNVPILIPPLSEQIAISEYIEAQSTKIATAISLKEKEIEKLKEYKASLINEAVTGKIKVN
jgi:type I restriction enzyme, S subunit